MIQINQFLQPPIEIVDFSIPQNPEIEVPRDLLKSDEAVTLDTSETFFLNAGEKSLSETLAEVFSSHRLEIKDLDRYAEIIELCPCAAFVDDENGRCVLVNTPFCQIFGCSIEDVIRDGWQKLIDPSDSEDIFGLWRQFVCGEVSRFDRTCGFIHSESKEMKIYRVKAGKVNGGSGFVGFVEPV